MKTKTFLLICLFLGIGLTQASAQTKSFPFRAFFTSADLYLENPVFCDVNGAEVDRLVIDYFTYQGVYHLKNGVYIFQNNKLSGQATSLRTGEVFKYKEIDKTASETTYHANFNLIGDQGHHYLQTFIIENGDGQLILHPDVIKAICK